MQNQINDLAKRQYVLHLCCIQPGPRLSSALLFAVAVLAGGPGGRGSPCEDF